MSYFTNTTEISFPGAHGTIGGAYENGQKEKSNQLGFAIFNYMYEKAQSAGVPLKPLPDEYKPSAETVAALNNYLSLQNQYQQIPTADMHTAMQNSLNALKQNYIHDERILGLINRRNVYYQQ